MGWVMITPDNFRADPYGWLTNQLGHIMLGLIMVYAVCVAWWAVSGELPYRLHVGVGLAIFYIGVIELWIQGWRGGDTIEDSVFTLGYGAAAPLCVFQEVAPDAGQFTGRIADLTPFFYIAGIHLLLGVTTRIYLGKSSSKE